MIRKSVPVPSVLKIPKTLWHVPKNHGYNRDRFHLRSDAMWRRRSSTENLNFLTFRILIRNPVTSVVGGCQWDDTIRCKYGISGCDKIRNYDHINRMLEREVEPLINALIKKGNKGELHTLLELLRGNFPRVYRDVERR